MTFTEVVPQNDQRLNVAVERQQCRHWLYNFPYSDCSPIVEDWLGKRTAVLLASEQVHPNTNHRTTGLNVAPEGCLLVIIGTMCRLSRS